MPCHGSGHGKRQDPETGIRDVVEEIPVQPVGQFQTRPVEEHPCPVNETPDATGNQTPEAGKGTEKPKETTPKTEPSPNEPSKGEAKMTVTKEPGGTLESLYKAPTQEEA